MLHHKLQMLILSAFAGIYPTQNERARFAVGLWYNNLTRYRNQRFRTGPESLKLVAKILFPVIHLKDKEIIILVITIFYYLRNGDRIMINRLNRDKIKCIHSTG